MASSQSHGVWENSVMSCCPVSSCLLAWCLPCILFGRTSSRMRKPNTAPENVNCDCMIFFALSNYTPIAWMYNAMKRGEIREKFGIEGSACGDLCVSVCCPCCALIQQDNEVKGRLARQGVNTQGYQPVTQPMQVPPPSYNKKD